MHLEEVLAALEDAAQDENTKKAFRSLALLLSRVMADVAEIVSTIRGQNGHDGMISRVASIETDMEATKDAMEKMAATQKQILDAILKLKVAEKPEKSEKNTGVTFQWLVEKVFLPLVLPVAVSIVMISLAMQGYFGKLGP